MQRLQRADYLPSFSSGCCRLPASTSSAHALACVAWNVVKVGGAEGLAVTSQAGARAWERRTVKSCRQMGQDCAG